MVCYHLLKGMSMIEISEVIEALHGPVRDHGNRIHVILLSKWLLASIFYASILSK